MRGEVDFPSFSRTVSRWLITTYSHHCFIVRFLKNAYLISKFIVTASVKFFCPFFFFLMSTKLILHRRETFKMINSRSWTSSLITITHKVSIISYFYSRCNHILCKLLFVIKNRFFQVYYCYFVCYSTSIQFCGNSASFNWEVIKLDKLTFYWISYQFDTERLERTLKFGFKNIKHDNLQHLQ